MNNTKIKVTTHKGEPIYIKSKDCSMTDMSFTKIKVVWDDDYGWVMKSSRIVLSNTIFTPNELRAIANKLEELEKMEKLK